MIYRLKKKKICLTWLFIIDICPLSTLDKSAKTQTPFYLDFGNMNNVE